MADRLQPVGVPESFSFIVFLLSYTRQEGTQSISEIAVGGSARKAFVADGDAVHISLPSKSRGYGTARSPTPFEQNLPGRGGCRPPVYLVSEGPRAGSGLHKAAAACPSVWSGRVQGRGCRQILPWSSLLLMLQKKGVGSICFFKQVHKRYTYVSTLGFV